MRTFTLPLVVLCCSIAVCLSFDLNEVDGRAAKHVSTSPLSKRMNFYKFDSTVDGTLKTNIEAAIKKWTDKVKCIKFQKVTKTRRFMIHILFKYKSDTCLPSIGVSSGYTTTVIFGDDCKQETTILRMIGNLFGLVNENQRADKRSFFTHNKNNWKKNMIKESNRISIAKQCKSTTVDYLSVMIPRAFEYSINDEIATIIPKDSIYTTIIGNNPELTKMDIATAICIHCGSCGHRLSTDCLNGGILGPDCECSCPSGLSGTRCENGTASDELPICKKRALDKSRNVKIGKYDPILTNMTVLTHNCFLELKPGRGDYIILNFFNFDYTNRELSVNGTRGKCLKDKVTVTIGDKSEVYCGKELHRTEMNLDLPGTISIEVENANLDDKGMEILIVV